MAFNYLIHAQHDGAGDNSLNVPYHLSSPLPLQDLPKHSIRLLALLAIHNHNPHAYEIQCDSMSIKADEIGPEQLAQDGDYEIYSNFHCEYIKIIRIQAINEPELSTVNSFIPCTKIHLTQSQANSLILANKALTA